MVLAKAVGVGFDSTGDKGMAMIAAGRFFLRLKRCRRVPPSFKQRASPLAQGLVPPCVDAAVDSTVVVWP
jgi:hypothetical protein